VKPIWVVPWQPVLWGVWAWALAGKSFGDPWLCAATKTATHQDRQAVQALRLPLLEALWVGWSAGQFFQHFLRDGDFQSPHLAFEILFPIADEVVTSPLSVGSLTP